MPFRIIRGDLTLQTTDAIVNSANPLPVVGQGVDSGIHDRAGPELLEARQKIGSIPVGSAAITPGYRLKARFVIHAVGPIWKDGTHGEAEKLRACYDSALRLAAEHGCSSISFPLISAGNYGFPRDQALQIAISAFRSFLEDSDMDITLVVFGRRSFRLSEEIVQSVESYIDDHYVQAALEKEYRLDAPPDEEQLRRRRRGRYWEELRREEDAAYSFPWETELGAPVSAPIGKPAEIGSKPADLESMLHGLDAGFSDTLLKLIDRTGKKDPEIYRKANVDRRLFSKIRTNRNYQPSKPLAVAFALALELNLEETRDLIGRAGFALSHSSKFDIIVEWAIEHRNYNIMEVNAVLFEYDQPQLG